MAESAHTVAVPTVVDRVRMLPRVSRSTRRQLTSAHGGTASVVPPSLSETVKAITSRFPGTVIDDGGAPGGADGHYQPVLRVGRRSERFRMFRSHTERAAVTGLVRDTGRVLPFTLELPYPPPGRDRTPSDFRVAAVFAVRNEEDILGWVLDQMMDVEEVDIYVIDNHSTDATVDVLRAREDRARFLGWESWPSAPDTALDWEGLLGRKAEVAADLGAAWVVHTDGDEVRRSPWPGTSLRDAVWVAEAAGATLIDFTVVNHLPVQGHTPTDHTDVSRLDHVELGLRPGYFGQKKCWRIPEDGSVVPLSRGGHLPVHPNPHVFGVNFRVDHYPVRSQAHGERKILHEFRARTSHERESHGWHRHYDHVRDEHEFERPAGSLPRDSDAFARVQAARLAFRAGMDPDPTFAIV